MAPEASSKTLREIVRVLAGRFVGMVLILAIVLAGVAVATHFAPRSYRSEARLLAKPSRSDSPADSPEASVRERVSLFVATQRAILMSDYVLASAQLMLEGNALPDHAPQPGPTTQPFAVPPALKSEALAAWEQRVQEWISGNADKKLEGHREQLARIRKRVEVVTPGGPDATFSQTLTVRVDWPEEDTPDTRKALEDSGLTSRQLAARRAHDFAQNLVQAHRARLIQLESERSRRVSNEYTQNALADARLNLRNAVGELEAFTRDVKGDLLSIINLTRRYSAGVETGVSLLKTDFQRQLDEARKDLAEVDQLLVEVNKQVQGIGVRDPQNVPPAEMDKIRQIVVPDAITAKNPSVTAIQGKVVALTLQLDNLRARYTPEYQEIKDVTAELNGAWVALYTEMDRIRRRLEQDKAVLDKQMTELAQVVRTHSAKSDDLAQKTARYQQLTEAVNSAQEIYKSEERKVIGAVTAQKLAANPIVIQILDQPSLPDPSEPRRPIPWVNLLVAGAAGLILALVYAFLSDHFDHSLKSIDQAERLLDAPVLASVPKLGRGIIRHARAPRDAAEPQMPRAWLKPSARDLFGGMWAALFYSGQAAGKTVLVCSADRQEGSSTIAAGLALAGGGAARVALVDLNLRNPALHRVLGVGGGDGVAQIVLEGLDPAGVSVAIDEGLDFYALGKVGPNALPLLHDEKLRQFLARLEEQYDHIVVDAAPVNRFPDARVLATTVRDVVLVAHTEHTPRQAIELAKKHLTTSGARLAGVVLNLRTYPIPKFLYRRV